MQDGNRRNPGITGLGDCGKMLRPTAATVRIRIFVDLVAGKDLARKAGDLGCRRVEVGYRFGLRAKDERSQPRQHRRQDAEPTPQTFPCLSRRVTRSSHNLWAWAIFHCGNGCILVEL